MTFRDPRSDDSDNRLRRIRVPWRAVAGGALVTCAAVGVFLTHRAASEPPQSRFLVAMEDIPAGATISADNLGSVAIDLPSDVAAINASDADDLIGRTVARAIPMASLISRGELLEHDRLPTADSVEVTVEVERARSPLDALAPGDPVHLVATDPAGSGSRVLTSEARIASIDGASGSDGIGASGTASVRLSLPDLDSATAVIDADVRQELTLVIPSPAASLDG